MGKPRIHRRLLSFGAVVAMIVAIPGVARAPVPPEEPVPVNIVVEVSGVSLGAGIVVENMDAEVEVVQFQDGADPALHTRPGRPSFGEALTLYRPVTPDGYLYSWWRRSLSSVSRRQLAVIFLAPDGSELMRHCYASTWPSSYEVMTFSRYEATEGALEFLVNGDIPYERVTIAADSGLGYLRRC